MNEVHVSIKKNRISDAVTENYVSIRNFSSMSLTVPTPSSLDEQFVLFPDLSQTRIHYWSSLWGSEWQPLIVPATVEVSLQVTSGRSSNGYHPFVIIEDGIRAMVVAIAWSGNWQLKIDSQGNSLSIKAGLHSKEQRQLVGPLEEISLPIVYVSQELISGTSGACRYLVEAFRSKLGNGTVPKLLMEWNSWWPYEDIGMNREVLLANAKIAAEVGLEIAILDAGWFGSSELDSNWFEQRGDWTFINEARFSGGLEEIASEIRSLGVEFGIWIEIEGLGKNASVLKEQPNFMAQRRDDGNEIRDLGYLCLGNAYAQVWALNELISLVKRLEARWVKVDFNADPEFGCNRVDHGHSAVDGLFAHVTGLYDVLDKFRKECPEVVLVD
jgi:alpha-galactosidase